MSERERKFSPQVEAGFFNWIKENNIRGVIFDFDGTLADTHKIFETQHRKFLEFCLRLQPSLREEELEEEFRHADSFIHERAGIGPSNWTYIVNALVLRYKDARLKDGLDILDQVYKIPPELFEGTIETLNLIQKANLKIGLVTHASSEWTMRKLNQTGLVDYFDHIEIVDPHDNRQKQARHWSKAVRSMGISPSNALGVGDNLRADIIAGKEAGLSKLAWVKPGWSDAAKGEKPGGIYEINEIGNLIETLAGVKS